MREKEGKERKERSKQEESIQLGRLTKPALKGTDIFAFGKQ